MGQTNATHLSGMAPETARERIHHAAARLYALQGFEGTSMRTIAEEAGVTKPLIYYHFESKEKLFSSLLREALGRCREGDRAILGMAIPSRQKIREMINGHVALARREPAVFVFAYDALTMPGALPLEFDYKAEGRELFGDVVRMVEEGQASGDLRAISPQAVAVVLLSSLSMYCAAVLSGDLEKIPDNLEDALFDLIMRGLEEVRG